MGMAASLCKKKLRGDRAKFITHLLLERLDVEQIRRVNGDIPETCFTPEKEMEKGFDLFGLCHWESLHKETMHERCEKDPAIFTL